MVRPSPRTTVRAALPSESRSRIMRAIRSHNTKPELAVRRLVHAMGYRFRLHRRDLPGSPDIVFPKRKRAVFVHGCFWHQHEGCIEANLPRTNTAYWLPKLRRTKARDSAALEALKQLNWRTLVIWECDLNEPTKLRRRLERFLG